MLTLVGFIALGLLTLSGLVLHAGSKRRLNKYFALLVFVLAVWTIANYIGANYKEYAGSMYFSKADFMLGPIAMYVFWLFASEMWLAATEKLQIDKRIRASHLILAISASLFSLTPLVASYRIHDEVVKIEYGALYGVYGATIGYLGLYGLVSMALAYRKAEGVLRLQAGVMISTLSVVLVTIGGANILIPQLTDSAAINLFAGNLAYAGILIFVLVSSYAIIRQQLFSVRMIVARSIAYILLLSTLIGIYSVAVYGVAGGLYVESDFAYRITPLIAALFIAFTAPYFKRAFDRLTSNIFYRDSYDPQEFLDRLNKTIITNIELGILLRRAASVIEEYMKSDYAVFGIYSNQDVRYRVIGTEPKAYTSADLQTISEGFERLQTRVVTIDALDNSQAAMHKIFAHNDISVAVRLSSVLDTDNHTTGYLFLGHKKSGNTYSKQDVRVIEIVADELVIAIQNSLRFEEIQQFNVTLQNRINQATTKVKKSNEKLQALDQTKDDFISMASHQLRTPLTSMKGYISMVLDEDVGPINDNQRRMLQQAFISSQRMTYLISDLLNLSRLKTGKFVMETGPVNLVQIVTEEVDQLRESAHSRDLKLEFEPPKYFPELELDETKIRQVVMNFLDNAIYYTPNGGEITVELTEKAKNIELTVTDTGIGVPKNQQHHLFSKFYRAPNAKQSRPDGTGLGLYMAKKVVVGQGGAVIFRSSEGKGSTFGFTFPKQRPAQTETPQDDE